MTVAGIDIFDFIRGGKQAEEDYSTTDIHKNIAYQYAQIVLEKSF